MKRFEDIKIVCCFMAHHDDDWIDEVLEDISKYASEIYVNIHDALPYTAKKVKGHPKVKFWVETEDPTGRWDQGLQRDITIRLLDSVKPDIVLFPDSDELYPANMREQLKKFWEDEKAKTFWFRLLYMWGDRKHLRNDGLWKKIHHVRAYKWQPKIGYFPYAGYACPTTFISLPRETRFHTDTGIQHLGYMTEESRQDKFARNDKDYVGDEEFREKVDEKALILDLPEELS